MKLKNRVGPKKNAFERSGGAASSYPVGIRVFGWLIIIGSLLNILAMPVSLNVNGVLISVFYFVISAFSIVVVVNIFKMKNWARIAIIVISVLVMVETLASYQRSVKGGREEAIRQFDAAFAKVAASHRNINNPAARNRLEESREASLKAVLFSADSTIMAGIMLSISFNCAVIIYFSRRRIREFFT
ncbi:MAG: hypothetical protein NC938_04510 [Candidatus Omnitrophica bacterium]|nr:hypothetical protein [Candidatus Omnitrophota bacterium]MCM8790945.1 hypothetical protein [Candidatus Omnitrophota bacterium]